MAMFAPTAETFRQFLEQQDFFVFIVTIYVGAGLIRNDRRANALQIYLSKPLMRTEYIFGKAAFCLRSCCSSPDSRACCCSSAGAVRGQLRVLTKNSFCSRRSPSRLCFRRPSLTFTMLALSSLSKSADMSHSVYRHPVSSLRRSITRCSRSPAARAVVDFAQREPDAGGRRDFRLKPRYATPWPVSLIVILGSSRCRSRFSSGVSAAWRS
jgi:hypothetical protein